MGKLERFLGKPKKVMIGGEELELKPLTVRDLDVVMKLGDEKTRAEVMPELIRRTLKRSFVDATDEEIDNMGLEYFNDLVNGILEVNNLQGDKKKLQ